MTASMRLARPALLLGPLILASACSRGVDQLEVFFSDDLVEAPVRTIEIRALRTQSDCDSVMSHPHGELGAEESALFEHTVSFPVNPELPLLENAPLGETFVLDIGALDRDSTLVARACQRVTLSESEATELRIELHALPRCAKFPSKLDIMIALDTSLSMLIVDQQLAHLDALSAAILGPTSMAEMTTFSLLTFANGNTVTEVIGPTVDREAVVNAFAELRTQYSGTPLLYDGITKAAAILRERAVCGRRPALLLISSHTDDGSVAKFEDARIGIFAARGNEADDIFTYAITMTDAGFQLLDELIPEGVGIVAGSRPEYLERDLSSARDALNQLLIPPPEG